METIIAYHYSDSKFDNFDESKCDGFWFTDIEPKNEDMLNEIGAAGSRYCAKCEISFNEEKGLDRQPKGDVFEAMDSEGADHWICGYEGFTDYCVKSNEQIKILEWIEI